MKIIEKEMLNTISKESKRKLWASVFSLIIAAGYVIYILISKWYAGFLLLPGLLILPIKYLYSRISDYLNQKS